MSPKLPAMTFLRIDERTLVPIPARVLVGECGEMLSAERAREDVAAISDVIFVRADGFTLGAPRHLECVAYAQHAGHWTSFMRRPGWREELIADWKPIEDPARLGEVGQAMLRAPHFHALDVRVTVEFLVVGNVDENRSNPPVLGGRAMLCRRMSDEDLAGGADCEAFLEKIFAARFPELWRMAKNTMLLDFDRKKTQIWPNIDADDFLVDRGPAAGDT